MGLLTPLHRLVRRHFGFSRAETNGFAVLLLVLLGLFSAPVLLRPALPAYNPATDRQQLDAVAAELAAQRPAYTPRFRSKYPQRKPYEAVAQVPLAPFDPNALDETGWQARGLPRYLATRLVKYGSAIGGFKAKEQIHKAYGLTEEQYARLAPYIQLPEALPPRAAREFASRYPKSRFGPDSARFPPSKFTRKPKHLAAFDLNTADTTQLMQIRGVGRRLSARVVEYRGRLGGFLSVNQTAEIYSLRDAPDLVDSLRKYTFVAAGFQPAPINVNKGSFEDLYPHPYVGKRLARVLVAYRAQHGPFKQAADLQQIRTLSEEDYQKLLPYLRF
ncbi:helix-hairpin-helix domain-containing protein [Hymenobacter busanensis]|uniref:Helix-hairpin-helix domain-containing protein n=1 Tax=Hymenobacter busanensis TaxID=2607656 RepID=A0A7L5A1A0_9BACT|nr:helix-hairpin-helix domain-containing protein [Hymenobacter busanensis]KAA9338505.1 helix-hairpin-helix domain-containing protein [Hymenobacter busanensis]QHJ09067.1 helix-hairpin-helix domain-containing protein [Hymenobacter busanensis]